jgi:sterol desaturase/sphingolipid hydroxylase (fatty acid hydroxylase superfamily)
VGAIADMSPVPPLLGSPRASRTTVVTFLAALLVALAARRGAVAGLVVLGLFLVPLERAVPLRRQRVLRPGLLTDLTHLLVNGILVAAATVVLVLVAAVPLTPLGRLDLESTLPGPASVALAVLAALLGAYWGHRLTHQVPLLWRFHAVHHSIEHMDWVASGRLHPLDAAFTQACAAVPLVALGFQSGAFAGVAVLVTVLAIFQHANVRLRFPVVRWIVPTPEWHHWHHATDPAARDTNFGLPLIDKVFGTAYLPRDRRPSSFGILDPVPTDAYLSHLRYPFAPPR